MSTAHVPAPTRPCPQVHSDAHLLATLRRLAQGERTLSRRSYDQRRRRDDPVSSLYEFRFGTWNAALRRAGLAPIEQPRHLQDVCARWTVEQMLDALGRCLAETGKSTLRAYEAWRAGRDDAPPAITIRARLGSWSAATHAAC